MPIVDGLSGIFELGSQGVGEGEVEVRGVEAAVPEDRDEALQRCHLRPRREWAPP